MAGGDNHPNSSSTKPPSSSSSSHRKSRWKSPKPSGPGDDQPPPPPQPSKSNPPISKNNPAPKPNSDPSPSDPNFPPQGMGPLRRPAYGFHMLDRRTIVLSDGSVRSYFALPVDYQDFPGPGLGFDRRFPPEFARQNMNLQEENCLKGKYYGDDERERDWREVNAVQNPNRYSLSGGDENRAAKYMRTDGGGYENLGKEVDQGKLKRAFLRYVKLIHENAGQRKNYLLDGKEGPLRCYSCGRSSKDFPDMHNLIMHTYNKNGADLSEHLGLHKALCILMGWNYLMPPDNSTAYQFLSADEAAANQDDLIIWPPMVIIHNTDTGKVKDGRKEGLGNIVMNTKIRELGFSSGRSKSCYWREGHIGITLIKFAADQSGLREALRLAEFLEKSKRGRQGWAGVQSLKSAKDKENHPSLVTVDPKTREKDRILYGYLGTASDLDIIDPETKRKIVFESKREWLASSN